MMIQMQCRDDKCLEADYSQSPICSAKEEYANGSAGSVWVDLS